MKLRFFDGLKIVQVADVLSLEAKSLYRRLQQILGSLRAAMEAGGLSASEVLPLLDWSQRDFRIDLAQVSLATASDSAWARGLD